VTAARWIYDALDRLAAREAELQREREERDEGGQDAPFAPVEGWMTEVREGAPEGAEGGF
jgi:hypothetical protein